MDVTAVEVAGFINSKLKKGPVLKYTARDWVMKKYNLTENSASFVIGNAVRLGLVKKERPSNRMGTFDLLYLPKDKIKAYEMYNKLMMSDMSSKGIDNPFLVLNNSKRKGKESKKEILDLIESGLTEKEVSKKLKIPMYRVKEKLL